MSKETNVRLNAFMAIMYWLAVMPIAFIALLLMNIFKYALTFIIVISACALTLITGKKYEHCGYVKSALNDLRHIKL